MSFGEEVLLIGEIFLYIEIKIPSLVLFLKKCLILIS